MYKINYHKLVVKEDFKRMSKTDKEKIFKSIQRKLSQDPKSFGKPLRKELKGFYRLRVGMYRVIYRIEREKIIVFIVHVGIRKDLIAYIESAKRLKMLK